MEHLLIIGYSLELDGKITVPASSLFHSLVMMTVCPHHIQLEQFLWPSFLIVEGK